MTMKTKLKLNDPKKARRFFARKLAFTTGPVELSRWLKEGANVVVLDVRKAEDFKKGHVAGAVSLPAEKWHKASALKKGMMHVVYCYSQTCRLSARAALQFASEGFSVMELEGGYEAWKSRGLPVKKGMTAAKAASRPARRSHRPNPAEVPAEAATAESAPESAPLAETQTA
jgi:rhodanese-related sulfurtransferase